MLSIVMDNPINSVNFPMHCNACFDGLIFLNKVPLNVDAAFLLKV